MLGRGNNMHFQSLYKRYVMNDSSVFQQLYLDKFNSTSTMRFDININGNPSFFTYDVPIMSLISNIENLNQRINQILVELPDIAVLQYKRKSLIDEIECTNQIEGIVLRRKDINNLIDTLEKKVKTKHRFTGIVNTYLLLGEKDLSFKDATDIRKLYDEMLYSEIKEEDEKNLPDGKLFRKDEVHIYKTGEKIVHHGVMPEEKIIEYMNKALQILNDSNINVWIRVALFHYYFGYIHPFYDGNGRINRFISSYTLSKHFGGVIGFRLSMTIKENLSQYLDAFMHTNDVRNKADISTFIYEFLDIIYKSYQKTEIYVLEKKQIFEHYDSILDKIDFSFVKPKDEEELKQLLFVLIQCSVFGDFGLNKTKLCKIRDKGNTKMTEYLGILTQKNLCTDMQSGKYHYYQANLEELDKLDSIEK